LKNPSQKRAGGMAQGVGPDKTTELQKETLLKFILLNFPFDL
jgi:hypothetical protein